MLTVEEVARMTTEEKWQAIELLQSSLDDSEDPPWVERILTERRAQLERGDVKLFTLAEVEARYRASRE